MLDDPPSPCTGVCLIDTAAGRCSGCHRTLDEIATWSAASPAAKRAVLARIAERACAAAAPGE